MIGRVHGTNPPHWPSPALTSPKIMVILIPSEKSESFERINSISETNKSFNLCNSCKQLMSAVYTCYMSQNVSVTLRSKPSFLFAHVNRVSKWLAPTPADKATL